MDNKINNVWQEYVHFRMAGGILRGDRPTQAGWPDSIEFARVVIACA